MKENLMNADHKATNQKYRDNYDSVLWGSDDFDSCFTAFIHQGYRKLSKFEPIPDGVDVIRHGGETYVYEGKN